MTAIRHQPRSAAGIPATRNELAALWVDGPTATFNVGLLCRFDAGPFRGPAGSVDPEQVRAEVVRRARDVTALRRRLTEGRHPVWWDDGAFDPGRHVRCTVLPAEQDLLGWSAARVLTPLDRGAPMWRVDVVPLPGGEFALLFVAHHVLADGRTGAAILRHLLDAPTGAPVEVGPRPHRDPPTTHRSRWQQIRDAVGDLRRRAPMTSLYRTVGPHRRLAVLATDLDDLHAAEATLGATVNDVLLAAVTAGLRAFLAARGDPVDRLTLRASVPVSSGAAGQPEGMLLVSLPVCEPDSRRRLAAITVTTRALKGRLHSGGGNVFDVLRLPTPLARAAVLSMRRIARHSVNLFVTNVPGPDVPLSLDGARLLAAIPVAPLAGEVPLGIAALSYAGRLQVAINADAGIGDLGVLRDAMAAEFAILAAMARPGAPWSGTPETHDQRR